LPPKKNGDKRFVPELLARELGRQAVLIAARDELGLATRDETLGEPFPEFVTRPQRSLIVKVRRFKDAGLNIDLMPVFEGGSSKADAGIPADFATKSIEHLIDEYESKSRAELVEKLRGWGYEGKTLPTNEDNAPPEVIEEWLLEMNFVSQFAAVRAAHTAIARKGQSRSWLGVLVRGYANLALMTEHHWKSDHQAFAARALLYAKRMQLSNPEDVVSLAHLAYAEAIVGMHGAALAKLDRIEELQKSKGEAGTLPKWYVVLRPFCSFQREQLEALVTQHKDVRELAQRLSFQQARAFGDDRWLLDSAKKTTNICPEEYGVYAAIAIREMPLGTKRLGAFSAPAALAERLPRRIANFRGFPASIVDAAKQPKPASRPASYAAETVPIVRALREVTRTGDDKQEPSWSALGELIFEEQFVQAANYLVVSMDATESSHVAEVQDILPALTGHRYIAFIESYARHSKARNSNESEIKSAIDIVDARGVMQPLLYRAWHATDKRGNENIGSRLTESAYRYCDLTFPQLFDSQSRFGPMWWTKLNDGERRRRAKDFYDVSPKSPQALSLGMATVQNPTTEQAQTWESDASENPSALNRLGTIYETLKDFPSAIRCYERSIKLSPSKVAIVNLANAYRSNGQEELWKPTLEQIFRLESLGLEQASVHKLIAEDFMKKGMWTEAEPHALAAAQTGSAWGLLTAADLFDGRKRFSESEKYVQQVSQYYPSTAGNAWYFWCLRNGRGRLAASREPAQKYFSQDPGDDERRREQQLVYRISTNELPVAMKHAKYLFDQHNRRNAVMRTRTFYSLQMALLARELKDSEAMEAPLSSAERAIKFMKTTDPDLRAVVQLTCQALRGKKLTDEDRATIDKHLEASTVNDNFRCANYYVVGHTLELAGDNEHAKEYYERAVQLQRVNREISTLAGMRLNALKDDKATAK
jgi:tetratricopeptide (TPR) repeat protein